MIIDERNDKINKQNEKFDEQNLRLQNIKGDIIVLKTFKSYLIPLIALVFAALGILVVTIINILITFLIHS
jgi:hypothetical protein